MTVPIAHTAVATDIPLPPGADDGLVAAVEIRLGRTCVVIAEHADGAIGIGNGVQRVGESDLSIRNRCLEHAVGRIASMIEQRHARREAKASAQRREMR